MANSGTDLFDAYFRRADLDGDGQISGAEAVAFFQASNLPKNVLAQVWMHADSKKLGYLGRAEFYNALKLVTVAQSKRELTQEIVNAALYGPASSKIPPPQINLSTAPNNGAPAPQSTVPPPAVQNVGIRPHTPQNQFIRPLQGMPPSMPSPQQVIANQGMGRGGVMAPPNRPNSVPSTGWLGAGGISAPPVANSQSPRPPAVQDGLGMMMSGLTPRPTVTSAQTPSPIPKPQDTSVPANQPATQDSKALVVSGNGFTSDSLFGDVFSSTSSQPKPNTSAVATPPAGNPPVSTAIEPTTSGPQSSTSPNTNESSKSTFSSQTLSALYQQGPRAGKPNQQQQVASQSSTPAISTGFPAVTGNLASNQSAPPVISKNSAPNQSTQPQQQPWPKMSQSEIQKYTRVFLQVDTDRDGKITGEQARNLFLSWRLPREVLKQVWDLSDQDNDSMLSLREFCTALYLMERYREGRSLPAVLPSNIMPDQSLLPGTHLPQVPHGHGAWGHAPGAQQLPQQVPGASRSVPHAAARKPPRPQPVPHADAAVPPPQQKPKVPVLEKHLVDQLSQGEQDSLNSKFQEASEAEKKVEELEKEIVTAREKIQFYHTKMQELVFYKSRCDNRLNEITERVSADKHEVELLSKKYEEKYRQTGDVASKLTLEEATFRDIQERKMELYQAIVKMEQGDNADGALKERVDKIQSGLEELVKSVNDRCKQYGLRAKPTTLLELPFGWQPGVQEGAADWDEDWDKFNDEGYTFVKDLTLEVENVIAPPKTKSPPIPKETTSDKVVDGTAASSDANAKSPKAPSANEKAAENEVGPLADERVSETESAGAQSKDGLAKSPPVSPAGTDAGAQFRGVSFDGLPHSKDNQSEQGGAESVFSGEKGFGEPSWGTFDTNYDTDSVWGFDTASNKDMDLERHDDIFGPDGFGLKPIRTEIPRTENTFQGKTPVYRSSVFADSVPSTPANNFSYSPQKFSGGPENPSFDSFSRFDSFNMSDGGFFQSPRNSLSRFDSFRSTSDPDPNYGFSSRPDSFSTHDSGFPLSQNSFSRFDSLQTPRESEHGYGFDSMSRFDPLQTPKESDQSYGFDSMSRFDSLQTPRESDHFNAFNSSMSRFDSLQTPRDSDPSLGFDSFARFDSFRSNADTDHGHQYTFDDSDRFGSNGPFRTSFESQTPKKVTDNWNAF